MKRFERKKFGKSLSLSDEDFISQSLLQQALSFAASELKRQIIIELNQVDISVELKQKIENSITIEHVTDGKSIVTVKNSQVKTVEYGSNQVDEAPFVLRARFTAEKIIKTNLVSLLNNSKIQHTK